MSRDIKIEQAIKKSGSAIESGHSIGITVICNSRDQIDSVFEWNSEAVISRGTSFFSEKRKMILAKIQLSADLTANIKILSAENKILSAKFGLLSAETNSLSAKPRKVQARQGFLTPLIPLSPL